MRSIVGAFKTRAPGCAYDPTRFYICYNCKFRSSAPNKRVWRITYAAVIPPFDVKNTDTVKVAFIRVFAKVRFQKFTSSKIVPKVRLFAVNFWKKAKTYFIQVRIWSKVAANFVSALLAYNAPSICPKQNASATAYIAPNRTGQTGQAPLFVQQQHKQWTHGGLRE